MIPLSGEKGTTKKSSCTLTLESGPETGLDCLACSRGSDGCLRSPARPRVPTRPLYKQFDLKAKALTVLWVPYLFKLGKVERFGKKKNLRAPSRGPAGLNPYSIKPLLLGRKVFGRRLGVVLEWGGEGRQAIPKRNFGVRDNRQVAELVLDRTI